MADDTEGSLYKVTAEKIHDKIGLAFCSAREQFGIISYFKPMDGLSGPN
jgi:hypothetical protein